MDEIVQGTDRLTNTIKLGAHYSMMLNSRDDINQIINNIARQKEIENIRIYNKEGEIKFSNQTSEVDSKTNIKAEACDICHRTSPPLTDLNVSERIRIFDSGKGFRLLGIISPIRNEPGCATDACHVHPEGKKILGALDAAVAQGIIGFLAGMQNDEGGLQANTRVPVADLLSTFTGALTLADLGGLREIDTAAAMR